MTPTTRKLFLQAQLQEEPNDPELRYLLAMEFVNEGNDAEAVRHFREIFALTPNYPPAYHMAARALQRLNQLAEARAVLEQGIPIAWKVGNAHAAGEMRDLLDMLE